MQSSSRCRDACPERRLAQRLFVRLTFASCLLASILPLGVAHAAEERDESERWVPSFGVYFDVTRQKVEGSITTGNILGPPLSTGGCVEVGVPQGSLCETERATPGKILPDEQGNDTSITPLVGASLELMTPSLIEGLLRPRLFVRGDAAAAFGFERKIAGGEGPGPFALPDGITLRSGETVEFKTVVRNDRDANYTLPAEGDTDLALVISDANGRDIYREAVVANEFGTFAASKFTTSSSSPPLTISDAKPVGAKGAFKVTTSLPASALRIRPILLANSIVSKLSTATKPVVSPAKMLPPGPLPSVAPRALR